MSKKFTFEELEKMNCKQLRDIAKALEVSGRWDMNKHTLIMFIMDTQEFEISNDKRDTEEEKIGNDVGVEESVDVSEDTVERVKSAGLGTLIAFTDIAGKARTGKIIEHRDDGVIAETEYGAKFLVRYGSVLWVRFGKRWPRWVYNMLKGIKVENNGCE